MEWEIKRLTFRTRSRFVLFFFPFGLSFFLWSCFLELLISLRKLANSYGDERRRADEMGSPEVEAPSNRRAPLPSCSFRFPSLGFEPSSFGSALPRHMFRLPKLKQLGCGRGTTTSERGARSRGRETDASPFILFSSFQLGQRFFLLTLASTSLASVDYIASISEEEEQMR